MNPSKLWRSVLAAALLLASDAAQLAPPATVLADDGARPTPTARPDREPPQPPRPPRARPPHDPADAKPHPLPPRRERSATEPRSAPAASQAVTFDMKTRTQSVADMPSLPANLETLTAAAGLPAEAVRLPDGMTPEDAMRLENFPALAQVVGPTAYPFSAHARVFFERPQNVWWVCSGTIIDQSYVLTAGHCVNDGGGNTSDDWDYSMFVAPAYTNGTFPFGYANAIHLISWSGWIFQANFGDDIGVAVLDRPIGALTGWRSFGYTDNCPYFTTGDWQHPGYPATGVSNTQVMYNQTGAFDHCYRPFQASGGRWFDTEVSFNRQSYGGQSGTGAVSPSGIVYGVLSNGNSTLTNDIRLTSDKASFIGGQIQSNGSGSADLLPLWVKAQDSASQGETIRSMTYVLTNRTSGTWSGTVDATVYLSTDSTITTDDLAIGRHIFNPSLGPEQSITVDISGVATVPSNTPIGNRYVGVRLSVNDSYGGNNATNGQDAWPVTILAAPPSNNANLASLTVSAGALSPEYSAGTTAYAVSVPVATATTTVTAAPADGAATMQLRLNGGDFAPLASGVASANLNLSLGVSNTIDIRLTAPNGITLKTYTVTVTRGNPANLNLAALTVGAGALNPTFAAATTTYTIPTAAATTSTTVTATAVSTGATLEVRINGGGFGPLTSGSPSGALTLALGPNALEVRVTAPDGSKTYAVNVVRADVQVRFDPNPAAVALNGGTADVRLVVDTGPWNVDVIDIQVTFNTGSLSAVQFTPGPDFAQVFVNQANLGAGTIHYQAGRTPSQPSSGQLVIATLTLHGLVAGTTQLTGGASGVGRGLTVPLTFTNGSVQVVERRLVFTTQPVRAAAGFAFGYQPVATVQDSGGNTLTSDNSTAVSLAIAAGTGADGATLTCTNPGVTALNGAATFAGCTIDRPGTAYRLVATSTAGTAQTDAFNVTLAGDTNGDCQVKITDFSLVVSHYGETDASAGWTNPETLAYRADLNGDGRVTIVDFSLLVSRFNTAAATCAAPSNGNPHPTPSP